MARLDLAIVEADDVAKEASTVFGKINCVQNHEITRDVVIAQGKQLAKQGDGITGLQLVIIIYSSSCMHDHSPQPLAPTYLAACLLHPSMNETVHLIDSSCLAFPAELIIDEVGELKENIRDLKDLIVQISTPVRAAPPRPTHHPIPVSFVGSGNNNPGEAEDTKTHLALRASVAEMRNQEQARVKEGMAATTAATIAATSRRPVKSRSVVQEDNDAMRMLLGSPRSAPSPTTGESSLATDQAVRDCVGGYLGGSVA